MSDPLPALATLYGAERADRSSTLNVSLATMGAAVTYLIGTIAFYDKLDIFGWAIALLPFPMVCVAAFHSLLMNTTAIRARSILQLERALIDSIHTGLPATLVRSEIGVTASELDGNLHTAPAQRRLTILIAYGGVGAIYLAYVALMLWRAGEHIGGWVAVPTFLYIAALGPIALSWRDSVRKLDLRQVSAVV